jgi:hypothetical protein
MLFKHALQVGQLIFKPAARAPSCDLPPLCLSANFCARSLII